MHAHCSGLFAFTQMNNLNLVELEFNHFTIKGSFDYWKHNTKTVIVEGEAYHKEWNEEAVMNVDDFDKDDFTTTEIEFKFLDLKYKFTDTSRFSVSLAEMYYRYKHSFSSNNYVALIQLLFEEGKLDKRIKNIYTDKNIIYVPVIIDRLKTDTLIPVLINSYGFNNYLYAEIHLRDFLSIDNKNKSIWNYSTYEKAFSHLGLNLSDGLTFNNVHKLLLTKTK